MSVHTAGHGALRCSTGARRGSRDVPHRRCPGRANDCTPGRLEGLAPRSRSSDRDLTKVRSRRGSPRLSRNVLGSTTWSPPSARPPGSRGPGAPKVRPGSDPWPGSCAPSGSHVGDAPPVVATAGSGPAAALSARAGRRPERSADLPARAPSGRAARERREPVTTPAGCPSPLPRSHVEGPAGADAGRARTGPQRRGEIPCVWCAREDS
jgi:hypothetical protein